MEKPIKDPEMFCKPCTPGDYLIPKFCRIKMFYPELVYKKWFPNQQMFCKWHGRDNDCVRRNNFFNPKGPRIAVGGDSLTLVFCGVYQCCQRQGQKVGSYHFRGYDPELLVWTQLNAIITGRKAIEPFVFKDLERAVHSKTTFSMKSKTLRESLRDEFYESENEYYNSKGFPRAVNTVGDAFASPANSNAKYNDFPEIDSVLPNHIFPTDEDLINLYKARGDDIELYHEMQMQMIDAVLLKADKSFKVIKLVFSGGSGLGERSRSFDSIYSVMNERNQIVAQFFTRTADTKEVKRVLVGIKKRFELHGFPNIKLFYTDDCCHEYAMLSEPFPELQDDRPLSSSATKSTALAEFDFDDTFQQHSLQILSTVEEIEEFARNLSTMADYARREGKVLDIGFDAEWDMWDREKRPLTIQVSKAIANSMRARRSETNRLHLFLF
jgi:hypothetical protein